MILYKLFNKLLNVEENVTNRLVTFTVRNLRLDLGRNIKFVGWPAVIVFPGSKIAIGDHCVLRSRSRNNAIGINHRIIMRTQSAQAELIIGDHVGISGGAICSKTSVWIGAYCLIGSNVVIADNDFHSISPDKRYNRYREPDTDIPAEPVKIGRNVWIGSDSYILKGVTIGDNSVIGAGSIVARDIPSDCIAAGNPARVVKKL